MQASHLFHIGSNTKVETDDVIKGNWQGFDLMIANVKTTSNKSSDQARNSMSTQSFNGLFVRIKKDVGGKAFLVPKAKTSAGLGGLAGMKFMRDPNMTLQEQKAYNLRAMAEGIGGYTWHTGLTSFKAILAAHEITDDAKKQYTYYTDSETLYRQFEQNEKLSRLISKSFVQQDALNELAQVDSFKRLDDHLMDKAVQTTLVYAMHSGYIWVLVPAFESKFELSLQREISKETVRDNYEDLQLALASLAPFLN